MKKMIALMMAVLMMLSLIACGSADSGAADSGNADAAYTIGVCQLVQHEALDAATEGFIDTVNAALGEENINWDVQNAANDTK